MHSEVREIVRTSVAIGKAVGVIVLLLEVLIWSEFAEESEEDVQGFDHWFAVL